MSRLNLVSGNVGTSTATPLHCVSLVPGPLPPKLDTRPTSVRARAHVENIYM